MVVMALGEIYIGGDSRYQFLRDTGEKANRLYWQDSIGIRRPDLLCGLAACIPVSPTAVEEFTPLKYCVHSVNLLTVQPYRAGPKRTLNCLARGLETQVPRATRIGPKRPSFKAFLGPASPILGPAL